MAALEAQQPWMRTAWDHLKGLPYVGVGQAEDLLRSGDSSFHSYECTLDGDSFEAEALVTCYSGKFQVDIDWDLMPDEEFDYLLARELGQAWLYNTAVHTAQSRSAVGRALLYFATQDYKGSNHNTHIQCTFDAMADAIAHVAVGTPAAALDAYGATCFTDERAEPAALTEAVVRHALHPSGDDTESSWFTDTYATGAEAWAAVESITPRTKDSTAALVFPWSRSMVVTLLQDEFGGYCSPLVANEAAFGTGSFENVGDDNDVTDPWNTFGCEPGAPTGVTASAVSSGGNVNVAWTAPLKGGAPITGYTVQWRTDTQTWADASSHNAGATPTEYQIAGLDTNEQYVVRVRASNSIGDGPWAEAVNRLAAPAAVRVFAGNGRVDVEWDPPASGDAPLVYRVQWKAPADAAYDTARSADVTADLTDYAITGLTNGDPYMVQVRALDSNGVAGDDAESPEVTVGVPKAVANLTAAGRDRDFRVDWDAPDERGEGFAVDGNSDPVLVYRISWMRSSQPVQVRCVSATAANRFKDGEFNPFDNRTYNIEVEARFETVPAVDESVTACADQTGFGPESTTSATVGTATTGDSDNEALEDGLEAAVAAPRGAAAVDAHRVGSSQGPPVRGSGAGRRPLAQRRRLVPKLRMHVGRRLVRGRSAGNLLFGQIPGRHRLGPDARRGVRLLAGSRAGTGVALQHRRPHGAVALRSGPGAAVLRNAGLQGQQRQHAHPVHVRRDGRRHRPRGGRHPRGGVGRLRRHLFHRRAR